MLKVWKSLFLILLIFVFLWLTVGFLMSSHTPVPVVVHDYTQKKDVITVFPHSHYKRSSEKVILLWTDYFGSSDWEFRKRFLRTCKNKRCKVTSNRGDLPLSDAVLFNSRSVFTIKTLPQNRTPDQVWVLHNSEPPFYIFMDWERYNGVFNWTSWFRRDADVYSPYGNCKTRLSKQEHNVKEENFFTTKKNFSFWAASSCTDRNRRYRLISELEKYTDIDTYGACGRLVCAKSSPKCNSVFRDYKFAFAFENGQCRDYVTEKFWEALARNQIPVVMGGADYKTIAPPGSYIDVKDFRSAKDLAAHLSRVGNSEELYNSYFSWRKRFELTEDQVVGWCHLCNSLHDSSKPAQVYADLKGWVAADNCKLYSKWDTITDHLARLSYLLGF